MKNALVSHNSFFYSFLVVQKVLKVKKSIMFHIFTSHVAKNGWKKPNSHNFVFSRWKMGGLKQGYTPSRPLRGLDGYPCFRPPIFQLGKHKITAHMVFPTIVRNCIWKNVKQHTIFSEFSETAKSTSFKGSNSYLNIGQFRRDALYIPI